MPHRLVDILEKEFEDEICASNSDPNSDGELSESDNHLTLMLKLMAMIIYRTFKITHECYGLFTNNVVTFYNYVTWVHGTESNAIQNQ